MAIQKTQFKIKVGVPAGLDQEDKTLVKHAVKVFGYLVKSDSVCTFRELAQKIEQNYELDNPRTQLVVRALKRAEPVRVGVS